MVWANSEVPGALSGGGDHDARAELAQPKIGTAVASESGDVRASVLGELPVAEITPGHVMATLQPI